MNEVSSRNPFGLLGILLGRLQSIAPEALASSSQVKQLEARLEALPLLGELKGLFAILFHQNIGPSVHGNPFASLFRPEKALWYLLSLKEGDPMKELHRLLTNGGRKESFTRQQILKAMQTLLQMRILGVRALREGAVLTFLSFQTQDARVPLVLRYEGKKSKYYSRTGLRRLICLTQTKNFGTVQVEFLLGPRENLQITISTEKNHKAINEDRELSRIAQGLNARIRTRKLAPAKAQPLWLKINAQA